MDPTRYLDYLDIDLDLESQEDLSCLIQALEKAGLVRLQEYDGRRINSFAVRDSAGEPELSIATCLSTIEALPSRERAIWDRCTRRQFTLGYDFCYEETYVVEHRLSSTLLERIAAVGCSIEVHILVHNPSRWR